jgi:type VI protein secretion system component Hcp
MEERETETTTGEEAVEDLELQDDDAEAVQGGKVDVHDISITKKIDKSSPTLLP